MRVGDLVRYRTVEELGVIVDAPQDKPHVRVVWFTCDNEGWWNIKNLEVVSGTTSR